MAVRYSTNWMGPISLDWYRVRGLTKKAIVRFGARDREIDEITEHYSAGRIDFFNPHIDSTYPDEMSVPPMRSEDWDRFSEWLIKYETDDVLTLEQLVYVYELKNPKIRWWKENDNQDV